MPQNDDLIKSIQELLEKEREENRKMVREGVEVLENRMGKLDQGQVRLEKRIDTSETNIVKEIKDLSETLGEVMAKAITRSEFEERLKPIEDVLDIPHSS